MEILSLSWKNRLEYPLNALHIFRQLTLIRAAPPLGRETELTGKLPQNWPQKTHTGRMERKEDINISAKPITDIIFSPP